MKITTKDTCKQTTNIKLSNLARETIGLSKKCHVNERGEGSRCGEKKTKRAHKIRGHSRDTTGNLARGELVAALRRFYIAKDINPHPYWKVNKYTIAYFQVRKYKRSKESKERLHNH